MNVLPIINTTSFKGREIFSTNLSYDQIKQMPGYHPNSTIEVTLGWNHKMPRERVYFADPMEPISEDLKRNVDYIVYDNEPKYPELEDIRKNYLEHNRTNYRDKFEEIREYFYRREMGGFANVEEAKQEQKKAAECTGFYDRAGDLRYKKEIAEDDVKQLKKTQDSIEQGINSTKKEIGSQELIKKTIGVHIENLEKLKKPYDELSKLMDLAKPNEKVMYSVADTRLSALEMQKDYEEQIQNTAYYYEGEAEAKAIENAALNYDKYSHTTATYDALHNAQFKDLVNKTTIQKQADALQKTINTFILIQKGCEDTIIEMQKYIAELRVKSAKIDGQILFKNSFIEDCKSQLEKHFEELKKFYIDNIIKIAKK